MQIIGLTGAIGAGKSTLSKALRREGVPVHSSDEEVHLLMKEDLDVQRNIKKKWPDVFSKGKIDRVKLRKHVLSMPKGLSLLEDIFYAKLVKRQKEFLEINQRLKIKFVAVDVPLLFETGLDRYCHYVIVASTPVYLRKIRVLRRKGMNESQFQAFEAHQMEDEERKKRADFVIHCGVDKGSAHRKIREILANLSTQPENPWQGKWPTTLKRINHGTRNRFRH